MPANFFVNTLKLAKLLPLCHNIFGAGLSMAINVVVVVVVVVPAR